MSDERVKSGLLGVLPDGWSAERLGNIGLFLRGGGGSKQDEVDDGLPCVRYGDLYTHHDCRITDTRSRISPDRVNSYTPLRYGDVLFASSGETVDDIGRSAVNLIRGRAYCGGDVIILRPAIEINSSFLGHVADCASSRIQKSRLGRGSTVIHIYDEELRDLVIPVPPLEEQRRIAEILDTVDETIQATQRVIAKLSDVENGLRRDLLDKKFEGTHAEHWRRCRIGDFASVQRGASPRPIDNPAWFSSDGPGWIRISDVTAADEVLLRTRDHLSPAGVARSRCVFPGGVIMSIAATIGVAIVVGIEACYHDGFVRIDHDGSVIPEFLAMLLEHHRQDFIRSGQTGTQANINSSIVAATEVALPSLDAQSEIVAATSAVRYAIRTEKDSCRALQATRAGLAADLLSGRVQTVAA